MDRPPGAGRRGVLIVADHAKADGGCRGGEERQAALVDFRDQLELYQVFDRDDNDPDLERYVAAEVFERATAADGRTTRLPSLVAGSERRDATARQQTRRK